MKRFLLWVFSISWVLSLLACASASPQQRAALRDQQQATKSAEERVRILEVDREALQKEISLEQSRSARLQEELDTLTRRMQ